MQRSTRPKAILAMLAGVALGACSSYKGPPPDIGDGGFLSGTPCSAPCFFGIEPGSTTLSEAQEILAKAALCPNADSFDTTSEGGTKGFQCGAWITVGTHPGEEIIDGLGFTPSVPMTLADVVSAIGPPDAVTIVSTGIPESQRSTMLLFYDQFLTRLLLPEQQAYTYNLQGEIAIERVVYIEEAYYAGLRAASEPWAGFGEYKPGE